MARNVSEVLKVADQMNAVSFSDLMTDDVKFMFSNGNLSTGRDAVVTGLNYLFSKISALRHDVTGIFENKEGYAVEAVANYTMKDGNVISLPVVSVMKYRGSKIYDYRIYMDISPIMTYQNGGQTSIKSI
ncbi:MAG: nuclear transport factor 2 family protein [Thermoplasmata archaeon]